MLVLYNMWPILYKIYCIKHSFYTIHFFIIVKICPQFYLTIFNDRIIKVCLIRKKENKRKKEKREKRYRDRFWHLRQLSVPSPPPPLHLSLTLSFYLYESKKTRLNLLVKYVCSFRRHSKIIPKGAFTLFYQPSGLATPRKSGQLMFRMRPLSD